MPFAIIGTLVFVALVGGIIFYAIQQSKKQDQIDLKSSAEFAEACACKEPEIAEETVKIELAMEPKVSKKPAKMTAKKKAKKLVKKEVVVPETFELQPVKPKKPRAKKPTV
jgi:hypothetical protein